jgi:dTDP-4-amino-4,6-dideoxygalactose transaminase
MGATMVMTKATKLGIPFNRPYLTGRELSYIAEAHMNGQLAGDGEFTKRCQKWLEDLGDTRKALLTHSCTAALEMAAILCEISPGDEVIMPSYTFVSTANAFVLRGATPVFVDIRIDTLNIDETKIEAAITPRTKAIVAVHYAGVSCEMDAIMDIAKRNKLYVIEDAAQACLSTYKGRQLGTIADLGCFSFHETKNIISGEGGALLVNRPDLVERAEIIREKGTNRSKFIRGEVDKYTWSDIGSSFLPGEIVAAFLWAQMEEADRITKQRKDIWERYDDMLAGSLTSLRTPQIPESCEHNGHMYYVINESSVSRDSIIESLKCQDVHSVFHYVPLHTSPFASRYESKKTLTAKLPVTEYVAGRLIRLPIWIGLSNIQQRYVTKALYAALVGGASTESDVVDFVKDKRLWWKPSAVLGSESV